MSEVEKKIEDAEYSETIENAKKLLALENCRLINLATDEFNSFMTDWSKKHNCRLGIVGVVKEGAHNLTIKIFKND